MNKGGRNQDSSTKVLRSEEEPCWNTQTGELDDQDWKSTGGRRYEEDDEQASDVERHVVVWFCATRCAPVSPGELLSHIIAYGPSEICQQINL